MNKEMEKEIEEKARELLEGLFAKLEIDVQVDMSLNENEEEKALDVFIKTDSAGLLIGQHGTTMESIQSFLSMALRQSMGEWIRVNLDVDGWRDKQDGYLRDLAKQAAERARTTGEPQSLYNLGPAQRRVVHMALSEEDGVMSESVGEGEARYLTVKTATK